MYSSWVNAWNGDADEAVRRVERAMELSPQDPYVWSMRRAMAFAHFIGKRYKEAIACAGSVTTSPQNAAIGSAAVAASAALLGLDKEARRALQELRAVEPNLRLSTLRSRFPIVKDDDYQRFVDALRLAGMPE
jgi:predicted Zn-dependent protease